MTLALLLIACSTPAARLRAQDATADAAAPAVAPTAEEAVRLAVEGQGAAYAGDCAATRSPQDVGKVCSKLVDERGGMRAYLIGRTFSEFGEWVFVEQGTAGWRVAATAPLDFFDTSMQIPWPR